MNGINENKIYYWLSTSGMGSKKLNAALAVHSAEELYYRLPEDNALKDFFGKYTESMLKTRDVTYLDNKLAEIVRLDIRIMTLASDKYPQALKQSEVSPPIILYYRGSLECLKSPCFAIVGTRKSSAYGREVARNYAKDFAMAGVTVVSGLATGIDTFAHTAAAEFGKTVAVLGGGHKHIATYSQALAGRIVDTGGAVLSEYPPDFVPTKYSFPERNRIISGLSSCVTVVEADEKSGALITADYALEQGRSVYAVPGDIFSPKSKGTNALIKDSHAAITTSPKDILSDLRINIDTNESKNSCISLDIFEQKIYNLLQSGKMHYDEMISAGGFNAGELSTLLFSLEMKGVITRLPSNFYCLERMNS